MKERLDILLVERRLVESRTKAQWLIKNDKVLIEGKIVNKPGKRIDNSIEIELTEEFPYVGKGGIKLEEALNSFSISVENKICLDLGASIGGFTDCLIKKGALRVFAVDTATDLLHPSLLCEKMEGKVIPLLGQDARELTKMDEPIDLCTIDITFASLRTIISKVRDLMKIDGDIIALVKPLFETEFHQEKYFNIIHDVEALYKILHDLKEWFVENDIYTYGLILSPIKGKGGSTEFFYHLRLDKQDSEFNFYRRIDELLGIKG